MSKELLSFVLLDWVRRVIADVERSGTAPIPWTLRQTMAEVFEVVRKCDGPGDGPSEDY